MTNESVHLGKRVCRKFIRSKCRRADLAAADVPALNTLLRIFAMSQACNILEAAAIFVASGDAQA
jgi:hypothetical protein